MSDEEKADEPKQSTSTAQRSSQVFVAVIFVVLIAQNSAVALLLTAVNHSNTTFNSQSGVIMQEILKLVTCIGWVLWESGTRGLVDTLTPSVEMLKTSVPALLYLAQNNLQYVAARYLDASTFAVLYQLKILTTAFLSVIILRKILSKVQWMGLCALAAGSALVVLKPARASGNDASASSTIPGVAAILVATLTSGLAGVYFEKLLKFSTQSVASRNLVLASYSALIGAGNLYVSSGGEVFDFFSGFNGTVWLLVLINGWGGLLVAIIIKYADNLVKCFATTMAIIVTMVISWLFLGTPIGIRSVMGTSLVICAVFAYSGLFKMEQIISLMQSNQKKGYTTIDITDSDKSDLEATPVGKSTIVV